MPVLFNMTPRYQNMRAAFIPLDHLSSAQVMHGEQTKAALAIKLQHPCLARPIAPAERTPEQVFKEAAMSRRIIRQNDVSTAILPFGIEHATVGIDFKQVDLTCFIDAQITSAESGAGQSCECQRRSLPQSRGQRLAGDRP